MISTGDVTNTAEISEFFDVDGNPAVDVDSTPDALLGNDGDVTDNALDGSGGDENDSDIAVFSVGEVPDTIAFTGSSTVWFVGIGLTAIGAGLLLRRRRQDTVTA